MRTLILICAAALVVATGCSKTGDSTDQARPSDMPADTAPATPPPAPSDMPPSDQATPPPGEPGTTPDTAPDQTTPPQQ